VYVTHDQEEALSLADRLVVLRDGRVQQIGTPEQLHDHPANWHVADFMGYRNLIDLELESLSGRVAHVAGRGLRLAATAVQQVTPGQSVRVAVRPSDLVVRRDGDAAAASGVNTIEAVVNIVEYQGREFAVDVTTHEGVELHVKADVAPTAGETVQLTLDPTRALVYAESLDGVALAEEPAPALAEAGA
jgi:putative spermidine/putrescine transport system ATP-binding protein